MQLKLLGCKVIQRELYELCAHTDNNVEIRWMKAALHEVPGTLRPALQQAIDEIEADESVSYDAILLGYGLCSMGVVGLHTKRIPLVVPRAHDCITLILGSRQKYRELFDRYNGGVYWYSSGWIEQFKVPGKQYDEQAKRAEYILKYGEDNADYLIEMEKGWTQHYDYAAFIKWPGFDSDRFIDLTKSIAAKDALKYMEIEGEKTLLQKMVDGHWDDDFVIVKPGEELIYASDEHIMTSRKRDSYDEETL